MAINNSEFRHNFLAKIVEVDCTGIPHKKDDQLTPNGGHVTNFLQRRRLLKKSNVRKINVIVETFAS